MSDILKENNSDQSYNASDIEVLEGLEPVRKRPPPPPPPPPACILAARMSVRCIIWWVRFWTIPWMRPWPVTPIASKSTWHEGNGITITDNGRGIPVDAHPKFPGKSALEVILTTLHSGGKFSGKNYETAGGLHGVGISVVNALSDEMWVEVARDKQLYRQEFSQGKATGKLQKLGAINNRRGTTVFFHPDPEIFGAKAMLKPARLFQMARSKAYLFRGVKIKWSCDASLIKEAEPNNNTDSKPDKKADKNKVSAEEVFYFPKGLEDFLETAIDGRNTITPPPLCGSNRPAR